MGWFKDFLSGSAGSVLGELSKGLDGLVTSKEEKGALIIKMEEALQKRDAQIEETYRKQLDATTEIIKAEMASGDNYTRRARPTLVYAGLLMMILNYVLVPNIAQLAGMDFRVIDFPSEFWAAWGATVGIWSFGRTLERKGIQNPMVSFVTGSKKPTGSPTERF